MSTDHHKHYILGTKTLDYDSYIIEETSLEDLLIPMNITLKEEVNTCHVKLQECRSEDDGIITEIATLLDVVGSLQKHIEFTLEVLASESAEQVQKIKTKFSLIRHQYGELKSKDDFSPVPAKYVLLIFQEKLIDEFLKLMKQCFKFSWRGKLGLVRDKEISSRIKILTKRFETGEKHYAPVLTFPKEDIFSLSKRSSVWQDLYEAAEIKEVLSRDEAYESFKEFEFTNNMGHVIIQNQNEYGILNLRGAFNVLKDLLYFGTQASKAETNALLRLANLRYEEAFDLWNLPEQPFVASALAFTYPIVDIDELFYVPKLFPKITKEVILQEYADGTFNKIHPMSPEQLAAPQLVGTKEEIRKELLTKSEDKVGIRLLSNESLDFKKNFKNMMRGVIRKATRVMTGFEILSKPTPDPKLEGTIVIHLHGGGFVGMSSASHRVYLNRWVKNTNVTHFSIDYRLAPNDPYPAGLDDIWQGYLWIVNYAEKVLGVKSDKVIVVGDSAGGNLALALSLRLIRAGLPPPHACLLFYPALLVDMQSSSPSIFASLDDTVLSPSLLKYCVRAYVGEDEFRNLEDPFISPLSGSNELLEKLPPLRIVVGSKDPFHDDSWRLLAKMRKLKKDVRLIIHEHFRHGFLNHPALKNYHLYMEEACNLIRELALLEKESA